MNLEVKTLLTGLSMGESPRWHDGRLWVCDWGAQQIVAVGLDGAAEVVAEGDFGLPFCIDWLPDGRLLVVEGRRNLLLRRESDGSFTTHADLGVISTDGWNEIVVDGRGHIYVNGGSGEIALVAPDGSVQQVADKIAFPNGMAVTPDNETLVLADSFGRCLTGFHIAADGRLVDRRVWAALDGYPDGICIDSDNMVWYADVPNKRCVRVREGGEVIQSVNFDRGCFACMLGGPDRRTLFVVANEWRGMEEVTAVAQEKTGRIFCVEAPAMHAGWPGATRIANSQ
jgi:sugar lactone lactonase YvrE